MRRIVTVVGTDGSGKTTLSDELVAALNDRGVHSERVWLGAESKLMSVPRAFLKLFWRGRGSSESAGASKGYRAEIARKNRLATRFGPAIGPYVFLAMTDYRMQIAAKLRRHRSLDLIVADRYVFDVAVNIGLALGWKPDEVVAFAQRQLARFPIPQVLIFLRVEPEVSLSRKDDIPDVDYLRLRLSYYDAIAAAFGFTVLDGSLPIPENRERLLELVTAALAKPYVHYVHANNSDVGGADRVLALMADHARRPAGDDLPGYRVSVSLREETGAVATYARLGIPVVLHAFVRPQVSGRAASILNSALRAPATVWHFWRLLGRERPDIVHVNDLYDVLPAFTARMRGIPVVYHLRMIKTSSLLRRGFGAVVPRCADVSVSVSRAVRDHYFGPSPSSHRAEVVHDLGNSTLTADQGDVAVPAARPEPIGDGGRLVVMVGRIEPWKGQDVFLDAVARLPREIREQHEFAIVGGGVPGSEDYLARVTGRAQQLGVWFLGERSDVPAILRAADISVHSSTAPDPFPGVVVESLLAGAATIGADAGGVPEMITGPDVGLLVPPGDAGRLASALTTLLTDPTEPRVRFGERGRRAALAVTDPSIIDRRIAEIYQSLAPAPGHSLAPLLEPSTEGTPR